MNNDEEMLHFVQHDRAWIEGKPKAREIPAINAG